ncbi:hypothetical protein ELI48_04990 [Rhizobium ruizarguesonis]|uniref:hypothetical protein n=1 Tax=Rhizobium ruizarguesonis TaxID=2081791 RepID=UPI0010314938|nr:hypothetical protein [Rhizobium ruizarguesonis]TAU25586.1 hypothetical protein ELI48_04990 [Rhizobium ruizarguesonis]
MQTLLSPLVFVQTGVVGGWAIDAKARSGKRRARADGLDVPKDARATLTPTSRIRIFGYCPISQGAEPCSSRLVWSGPISSEPYSAELYRRKVERLTEALNDPEDRAEAASALRGVIEKIVLTPGAKRGEISALLVGELRTILAWANDQGDQRREAAGMFPWSFGEDVSVRVGSGPGITEVGCVFAKF